MTYVLKHIIRNSRTHYPQFILKIMLEIIMTIFALIVMAALILTLGKLVALDTKHIYNNLNN